MKNQNSIFYGIAIILLLGIGFMFLKSSGLFVITADDLPKVSEVVINQGESYELFSNFSIINETIKFNLAGQQKIITPGKNIFFMLDSSPIAYDSFPDLTDGTHTITKYQMFIQESTKINIQKFSKTYDLIVRTVQKNITVANQTFYVENIVYKNQTVTEYVNQTVEKQVMVEPTMEYILQKYQTYILGILVVGLIYYLTRRKKR